MFEFTGGLHLLSTTIFRLLDKDLSGDGLPITYVHPHYRSFFRFQYHDEHMNMIYL